jgi:hypothetical protein
VSPVPRHPDLAPVARLEARRWELETEVHEFRDVMLFWHDEHRADHANLEERVARLERPAGLEPK